MSFPNLSRSRKGLFSFLLSLLILAVIGLVGVVISNQVKTGQYISEGRITVTGLGEKYVRPDLALVSFSVKTEKETVREAIEENTQAMNEVIQRITDLGIASKDLQSIGFNLNPRYEWQDEKGTAIYPPSGKRVLVGYEVDQTLQVKIRDLVQIGEVIDGATKAGANEVSSLELTVEHPEEIEKEVRLQAVEQAKEEAQALANQLGCRLGELVEVQFNLATPPSAFSKTLSLESSAAGGGSAPQIEAGENLIQVTAYLTYQID